MIERRQRRDVRPRVLAALLADPTLGHREKVYLVAAMTVRAEHVDGKPRPGSRSMDHRGTFALHADYLARCMGASVDAVRRARVTLIDAGWLSPVHAGTFGRPATYQALVAGRSGAPVRVGIFCHPYEIAEVPPLTPVRDPEQGGAEVHTLTPTELQTHPDHADTTDRRRAAVPEDRAEPGTHTDTAASSLGHQRLSPGHLPLPQLHDGPPVTGSVSETTTDRTRDPQADGFAFPRHQRLTRPQEAQP